MKQSYKDLLEKTRRVTAKAAEILVDMNKKPRTVDYKGPIDLVTETDQALEDFLKRELKDFIPGASFLAEESATKIEIPDQCWIIDPLDGTTNYVHGLPYVAISVAYCVKGEPVLGVIEAPLINESWYASIGDGAFLNGEAVRVSSTKELQKSLISTGLSMRENGGVEKSLRQLKRLLPLIRGTRRCGAAALDMAWLAGGRFDAFFHSNLMPWDMAAGLCLIREAGGKVSHMDGANFCLSRDDILASNRSLHNIMLDHLED